MKNEKIKKILKIIIIFIWIAAITIIIHVIRNYIIITDLENKISKYQKCDNLHMTDIGYNIIEFSDNISPSYMSIITSEYYIKDKKVYATHNRIIKGKNSKITNYYDEGKTINLIEMDGNKYAILGKGVTATPNEYHIVNCLQTKNFIQKIFACFISNIRQTNINGKECYEINNYPFYQIGIAVDANSVVIEKETGLVIRTESDSRTLIRRYDFSKIDASVFIEPDITGYEVEEK